MLWSFTDGTPEKCAELEQSYFLIVARWNTALRTNRNKIRLLIGESYASRFLDYADDTRPQQPLSLHYQFVQAHNEVLKAKRNKGNLETAQENVTKLNWTCSKFLEDLTTAFLKRATDLELLDLPTNDVKADNKDHPER